MTESGPEQLLHLRAIRRRLTLLCLLVGILTASVAFVVYDLHQYFKSREPSSYKTTIEALGKSGDYEDVLMLAKERITERPDDPYGYYHAGMACYRLQRYHEAVPYLEKAEAISPIWKEGYTGPLIAAARQRMTEPASQTDGESPPEPARQ